jgi:hypothetical protein
MNDQYLATKPACLDRSSGARPSVGQDGVRAAAGKPWRRPELKVLAVEETKHYSNPNFDGANRLPHS